MAQSTVTFCEPALDDLARVPVLHVRVVADRGAHGPVALCGATVGADVPAPYERPVCKDCEQLLAV